MTDYYVGILKDISNIIYKTKQEYEKGSDEWQEIYSDDLDWYASKEKAYYRLIEIYDMEDFYNEEDFQYWALEKFSEARHRISNYIKRSSSLLNFNNIDYKKYDDIVIDYYQPIRLTSDGEILKVKEYSWGKYRSISYLRTIVNLGLLKDIEDIREHIAETRFLSEDEKERNLKVLDDMFELSKNIIGYKEDMTY